MSNKIAKRVINVELPQETIDYVQGVDLEANSRLNILQTLATNFGVKSVQYKEYQEEYFKFDAEYQLIKNKIQAIYVPKELTDSHELSWAVNFSTNMLQITVTCDCGIALVDSGKLSWEPQMEDNIVPAGVVEEETECEGCQGSGCACGK